MRKAGKAVEVILDGDQISDLLETIAGEIFFEMSRGESIALVGIRSRGEILAQRLQRLLHAKGCEEVDLGTLDITLYRDDLNQMGPGQPQVRSTEIEFDINDHHVILVDDVLWTGRSIRAGLDALMDLGRPRVIRLAVLLDRGNRELPISADYVGEVINPPEEKKVQVYLQEADGREEVVLE